MFHQICTLIVLVSKTNSSETTLITMNMKLEETFSGRTWGDPITIFKKNCNFPNNFIIQHIFFNNVTQTNHGNKPSKTRLHTRGHSVCGPHSRRNAKTQGPAYTSRRKGRKYSLPISWTQNTGYCRWPSLRIRFENLGLRF